MRHVVTVVAQIPFHKLLQSLLQYLFVACIAAKPELQCFCPPHQEMQHIQF